MPKSSTKEAWLSDGDDENRGPGRIELARLVVERGLQDVRAAMTHGVDDALRHARRPTKKGRKKKVASDAEDAVGDPAAYFDAQQRAATEELGTANILISGQTGVGKSTLINAVLRAPVADAGTGKPVTKHVRRYEIEDVPVAIFDTPGIELGQAKDDVIREYKRTIQAARTGRPAELIHLAWYCVDAGQARVQDFDLDIIRALAEELEVILVLTQCVDDERADALEEVLSAESLPVRGEPIRTLARPRTLAGQMLSVRGLEELVDRTNDILPEAVRRAFANAQGVVISLKGTEARKVVAAMSTAAAAVGATPIPAPDAVVLLPLQLGMLARINAVFGIEMSRDGTAKLIKGLVGGGGSTLVGRQMAETLLKYLPGGAVINAGVAAAITGSLGEAYIQLCTEMMRRQSCGEPMPDVEMLAYLMEAYTKLFQGRNPFRRSGK